MKYSDPEEVSEILKQYGDWLYSKGKYMAAMEQYIKTIPHLEPSYVIKKVLAFLCFCIILAIGSHTLFTI